VGHASWNHEGLTFANSNVPRPVFFEKRDHNVTLQLQEELLTVRDVKVISCIGTRNAHGKEVLTVIEVLVGDRRSHIGSIRLDPIQEMFGGRRHHPVFDAVGHRSSSSACGFGEW
jgi:hypothetical protein